VAGPPGQEEALMSPREATTGEPVYHAATLLTNGHTVCLGCGKAWPCADAPATTQLIPTGPAAGPRDVLANAVSTQLPWPLVADQMGVDRDTVQHYIDTSNDE
jgi:hypothetical protein